MSPQITPAASTTGLDLRSSMNSSTVTSSRATANTARLAAPTQLPERAVAASTKCSADAEGDVKARPANRPRRARFPVFMLCGPVSEKKPAPPHEDAGL